MAMGINMLIEEVFRYKIVLNLAYLAMRLFRQSVFYCKSKLVKAFCQAGAGKISVIFIPI